MIVYKIIATSFYAVSDTDKFAVFIELYISSSTERGGEKPDTNFWISSHSRTYSTAGGEWVDIPLFRHKHDLQGSRAVVQKGVH